MYLKSLDCNLIPFIKNKSIYYCENDPNRIVKGFTDLKKMDAEYTMHWRAQSIVPCPKILETVYENHAGYIVMERIKGKTIYDVYGSDEYGMPSSIWVQIHSIIYRLFANDIHYEDVTPFNFMIEDNTGKIYILDFGHAYEKKVNWFLKEFLDGENTWNSDFA